MDLAVEGANIVDSFIMRSITLGKLSCRQTTRHGVQILAEINVALRDVLERSVTGFLTNETWLEQHCRATKKGSSPTVMMFSVWEYVGRITV